MQGTMPLFISIRAALFVYSADSCIHVWATASYSSKLGRSFTAPILAQFEIRAVPPLIIDSSFKNSLKLNAAALLPFPTHVVLRICWLINVVRLV